MKKLLVLGMMMFGFAFSKETIIAQDLDTYISKEAQTACIKYGEEYGICPELLMAIVEAESSGNPKAQNGDCTGLMQISAKWHEDRMERLGVDDLYDTDGNIHLGTDYLMELAENDDLPVALMKYNGDSRAMWHYETGFVSNYAAKIMDRSEELERIHGK